MTCLRKLSSAIAVASLFAAGPALAGNRDGFEPEREPEVAAQAAEPNCDSCPMGRDDGSGGGVADASDTADERVPEAPVAADPFDRSMDAGG